MNTKTEVNTPKAKKTTGKTMKAKLLSISLTAVTIFIPLAAAALVFNCDNGTTSTDTARDVKIAAETGYDIYVNCKPSQDTAKNNIETAFRAIIADSGWGKDYIASQPEIRVIVDDTLTSNIEIKSKRSFAIKYSAALMSNIALKGVIEGAIAGMDNLALNKQFDNAKETVRLARLGLQRPQGC